MLYILDFDGTIADTTQSITETTQMVLRLMDLPPADPERIRATIGLPLIEDFRLGCNISDPAQLARAVELYRIHFDDVALRQVTLFPRVDSTLRTLVEQGHTLSIATSRTLPSLLLMLDALGIKSLFSCIKTNEMVSGKKPEPDLALAILDELSAVPAEALVVGDTSFDILMGSRAGCTTCGVTYSNQSAAELQAAGADHIIDRFDQLLTLPAR